MLFEGAPLKAASCHGGREGLMGLPRILVSWRASSTIGDPGGSKTKGDGDWMVLPGFGTSKTSELKVSAMRMVGELEGEGTGRRVPRRENSSGRGDKKEGLAGY